MFPFFRLHLKELKIKLKINLKRNKICVNNIQSIKYHRINSSNIRKLFSKCKLSITKNRIFPRATSRYNTRLISKKNSESQLFLLFYSVLFYF